MRQTTDASNGLAEIEKHMQLADRAWRFFRKAVEQENPVRVELCARKHASHLARIRELERKVKPEYPVSDGRRRPAE